MIANIEEIIVNIIEEMKKLISVINKYTLVLFLSE